MLSLVACIKRPVCELNNYLDASGILQSINKSGLHALHLMERLRHHGKIHRPPLKASQNVSPTEDWKLSIANWRQSFPV